MGSYLRPTTLDEALAALAERPRVVLAGGTDHFPARAVSTPDEDILDVTALPGLRCITAHDDHWWLPCLATWTDVIEAGLPPQFDGLVQAARQVGGMQVQNVGTLVGNLCNASPAADGTPCLLALGAWVELASAAGTRRMAVEDFVLGARTTARRPDELVLGLRIPRQDNARSSFLKLGARRYLVISIVMVAANILLGEDGRVAQARVAVGACSARPLRLSLLEAELVGRHPDAAVVRSDHLADLAPIDDMRATAAYRAMAALELVRRSITGLTSIAAAA
jgi:CO/xanthine dehydrogenase FAD-binding subunit